MKVKITFALMLAAILIVGCSTAPKTEADRSTLKSDAQRTIVRFKESDAKVKSIFKSAYGYAIFPKVGKGAVFVGGAHGQGILYRGSVPVGYCDLSQATIGFQLGGQAYSEVIFFKTKAAFEKFKTGNFAFSAQASAVALSSGASADVDYSDGVLVFTEKIGGLMYEASIGGQKFRFQKMD